MANRNVLRLPLHQRVTLLDMRRIRTLALAAYVCLATVPSIYSQTMKAPDITREPTLYVVPYAHLDTQWRWEFPQSISEYLLKTMRVNFDYIEKYPHYVFNWTGSNRYRLMKEYFPPITPKLKSTWRAATGIRPAPRWKRAMSICPTRKPSSARSFTAIPISGRNSARPAPSTCFPIVSVSPPSAQHSGARGREGLLHTEA